MRQRETAKSDRIAFVTGAAGQIGSAVVCRLKSEGWKVSGIDLKVCKADLSLIVDITSREALDKAVTQTVKELGPIELLVTAASKYVEVQAGVLGLDQWQKLLDVWLRGTANACAAVVPGMRQRGFGTVVTTARDLTRVDGQQAYNAAAAATISGFTKGFACEVAPEGIRVNCVSPGAAVNPESVAAMVSFLANEGGDYYVAQVFSVR